MKLQREIGHILVVTFAICLFIVLFLMISGKYEMIHGREIELSFERKYVDLSYPLNINEATVEELSSIDGVSKYHAELIDEYRREYGIIHDLRVLINIKGIGRKVFKRLQKNTFVSFKDQPEEDYYDSNYEEAPDKQPRININRANWQEFTTIKGIGEKTAKLIIKYREEVGQIEKIEELLKVKGVGPKRINLIKKSFFIGN